MRFSQAAALSLAGAVATGLMAVGSPALATTSTAPSGTSPAATMMEVPMHSVGFDVKVAAEHGYVIRKQPHGQVELVNTITGRAVPENDVKGNCGTSWYFISRRTAKTWTFWTGFTINKLNIIVNGPVVDFSWKTRVKGPGRYLQPDKFGSVLAPTTTWQSKNKRVHAFGKRGVYNGRVVSGTTIQLDGNICHSGNPHESLTH